MNSSAQITSVGLIQTNCVENPEQNLANALTQIEEAAKQGAQIICLQELFRSQYFCQTETLQLFDLAEPIPGPSVLAIQDLCKRLEVVVVAPIFEKRAPGIYHNSAAVIDADGSLLGVYRKMHIPDDPCFYEKYYFTPGDLGFQSFKTRYGTIGVLICWDQWFPEAARLTCLKGAQILFYPTAIGYQKSDADEAEKQANAWRTIQQSHAIANGVFVGAANRVGEEGAIKFWGQSFVSGPQGEILAQSPKDASDILIAHCDLSLIENVRRNWPFLRDRRIDHYSALNQLYDD
ncbi:MAG: carbon-nitrogen hydrolase [Candidatus Nitrohelix vancouverensis]|uniref:Carbon-nitrogen hydrolase n=1 Tax=Candidatus Nitrohelix vancouverensis TaxID=2705534 RepID=A0A7T0C3Y8_9BACT|nr:MAG: carbon-nitrogen hydrolase [Candidatus Nitrohelix vancouverensis]